MIFPFLEQDLYLNSFRNVKDKAQVFFLSLLFLKNQLNISIPKGIFWGWQNFGSFSIFISVMFYL